MKSLVVAVVAFVAAMADTRAYACSTMAAPPGVWVKDADVIVRVRAVAEVGSRWPDSVVERRRLALETGRERGTDVRFNVLEILKGVPPANSIDVQGYFSDDDDWNDHPAPYTWLRRGGRGGDCKASNYKQGRQYLLLLKRDAHQKLTPYWHPMAATNEPLHDDVPTDPWLAWVRAEVRRKN